MEEESTLREQIASIDWELGELERVLQDDTLYAIPTVLYHEPQEVPGFDDLLTHLRRFEPRLRAFIQSRRAERWVAEGERSAEFVQGYQDWTSRLRKVEAFDPPIPGAAHPVGGDTGGGPVLPPAATISGPAAGRSSRRVGGGDVVRSEAEMNQILLSLLEQERDNPATRWMATLAVTPRMRASDPRHIFEDVFVDNNGLLPQNYYQERPGRQQPDGDAATAATSNTSHPESTVVHVNGMVVWTEAEQRVFVDKFLAYPKNFRKIASYLPFKRTADCVAFYYRSKKRLRLKQLRRMLVSEGSLSKARPPRKSTGGGLGGPGRPPKRPRGRPGRPPKHPRPTPSDAEDEAGAEETSYELESEGVSSTAASLSTILSPDSPSGRREGRPAETSTSEAEIEWEGTGEGPTPMEEDPSQQ